MKIDEIRKALLITDKVTHVHGFLHYRDEAGTDQALDFIYNEGGLRFRAKHYHGYACVFHGYDDGIYTDASAYLEAVCQQDNRKLDFTRELQAVMHKSFMRARLQKGQPVRVMVPDAEGVPLFYEGFVKQVIADEDTVVVTYDGGKRVTAKPKRVGRSSLTAYQGRGGSLITLGGVLQTNQNNVVQQ